MRSLKVILYVVALLGCVIFNGYAHEREIILSKPLGNQKRIVVKNAETLLVEPDNSDKFDGQLVGISSAVGSMNKSEFDFKVSSFLEEDDGISLIETEKQFEDSDVSFMASKIISNFPNLDLHHLKNLVENGPKYKK